MAEKTSAPDLTGLNHERTNRKSEAHNLITKIGMTHGHLPENREPRRLPCRRLHLPRSTSKRLADNDCPYCIGQFGSGNKHAVNVLLRAKLFPVVFCGNHRLEFTTKPGRMKALEGEAGYNRVVVEARRHRRRRDQRHLHRGT